MDSRSRNNVDKMTSLLTKDSGHANKQDGNGYTALHYAARAGHREACKLLLSHGADVNARLRGGDTAMHRASYKGRAGVVELLISHGAEAIQGADGQTPLHKAVEQTQLQTAKLLVESYPHLKVIRDDKQRQPIDLYSGEDVEWLSLLAEG
ncbi:hypothetical protein EB796_002600 [Bugula neritina]|uniref:Uncharacterized protein n=1 Tax=Bugula neritina TaxID=10212 RepID=A0A7J7KL62_BUGNE|nr:hypothetical protein EB796_002600 [Bugula neritina]